MSMEILTSEEDMGEPMEQRELLNEKLAEAGIDEAEVLAKARDDVTIWDGYFSENITRGKDDMNFVLRDQWTAVERSEFNRLFKPAMTFNKLLDITRKVSAEQRRDKPDLLVRSLTGRATQQQIDLRADLIRTICYNSQTDLVYQTAFDQALMMGFGAIETSIEYEHPRSFDKVIRFNLMPDPTHCSFDPTAIMPHKGDGTFCSRQYIYTKDQFYAEFPWVKNAVSYADPRSLLDFQWETRDTLVVAKYTRKEFFPIKLYLLSNGLTVTEDEWEDMQEQFELAKNLAREALVVKDMIINTLPTIRAERFDKDFIIRQYMMTQNEIIRFIDWPSQYLPMIFVDGNSNFIQGQQYTRSFVHEAKDAQKFINYVGSEVAADIKNRRREQWIGTPDNILGYEQLWRNPELQNGILIAKPDPKTGQMPQKTAPWEISQSLLTQFQRGSQDIREIVGYSEQEALQGRDMSGKARRERKLEGAMSAYVYRNNLNQAIAQCGRVALDLLPAIYGERERSVILSKKDGKTISVVLNKDMGNNEVENSLDKGDYDVEIDTGPSFAVQKEVALEFFRDTIAANQQTFPLIADLWADNLDIQNREQVKERFKTMVPPAILAKEAGEPPPQPQPSPQEQMMQMEMEFKKQELQEKQATTQLKMKDIQLKEQAQQLEQVKLMLDAQKMQLDSTLNVYDHQANIEKTRITHGMDKQKAAMDYSVQIHNILADLYKHNNPHEKKPHQ